MSSKNKDRIVIGLLLLIIGAYYILKHFGVNLSPFFDGWWCLLLVLIGLYQAFKNKKYFGGLFVAGIGVVMFLSIKAVIASALEVPLLLVLLGILFIVFPKKDK